ncbi:ectoine/hydroxyectoine ABC transporter substrate-binding protein EhuB [Siminovitchia terrae]|uniref:Ectoine/hydroxyectoine ABC transporter substrate-binding protein EhuB n=1 Tax=Siminovitchia terrae TaxID=1914933 RepID=A0A429X3Y9_SIMTE|nr:ectoine/hydroxyectoine ABC transporter substrate-binding protein EhuB [Siminovitchia terrae]RST58115.1 ectoine/hydroxyectoine ABC transporter substrate-binding protein EhuB [Siminovitchia terrae]GIN91537.1 ectoine/hydroxyectoine ABC transporter substrate-binding protein EhuB [Siminovitchia terrae]GIN95627.1 ectoine/hydroxyectoine ABC transporter substrate-binding protein EhuB [Siminovitchia terrae]
MKKWLVIAVVGLLVILSACGNSSGSGGSGGESKADGSTLDRLKKEGKVKLGVANEKPYGYKTSDGDVTGVAPEITKAVFKEMGIDTVEGEVTEFGSLIPALQAGRFDVITAGMDIRPERCAEAAFGDVEIRYGEGMAVQKGNPKNLHSYEDIAKNPDLKVSIMAGANQHEFLKELGVKDSQIETADSISSNIAAVSSGRVDATVMTEATLREAVESADQSKVEEAKPFTQPEIGGESVMSYGAAVFRKEDNELREAYNAELKKLIDSGKILEIYKEFGFGEDNLPDDVTTADRCGQ